MDLYVDSAGMVEGPNIRSDQRCHDVPQKFTGYERSGIGPELELPQTQDVVGSPGSLGQ